MRFLLAVVLLVAGVALAEEQPQYSVGPEFLGTDYGDLIDEVRHRIQSDAYKHNEIDPGKIGRLRFVLNKINSDILREQVNNDNLLKHVMADYAERVKVVNATIQKEGQWLANADKSTVWSKQQIVNLTKWLSDVPEKIIKTNSSLRAVVKKIETGDAIRGEANKRFRVREGHLKDTISGTLYIMEQMGVQISEKDKFDKRLIDTLNKHHAEQSKKGGSPSLIKPGTMKDTESLNPDRVCLKQYLNATHQMLTMVTSSEAKWSLIWNSKKARLVPQRDALAKRLKYLVDSKPKSRAAIKRAGKLIERLTSERPDHVVTLARLQRKKKELLKTLKPLEIEYNRHKSRRMAQLKLVKQMLDEIHKRYDGNNLRPISVQK